MAGWNNGWGGGWDGGWQGGEPTGAIYTATGDLQINNAQISGAATRVFDAIATLQASDSVVTGGATVEGLFTSVGSLLVQPATLSGAAGRIRAASGALAAESAIVAGGAVTEDLFTGTGTLLAQPSSIGAQLFRVVNATAALQVQPAGLSGAALGSGNATLTPEDIAGIATAVMNEIIEYDDLGHGITLREATRLVMDAGAGRLTGAETTTVQVMKMNKADPRITATVDKFGNRIDVTHDYS